MPEKHGAEAGIQDTGYAILDMGCSKFGVGFSEGRNAVSGQPRADSRRSKAGTGTGEPVEGAKKLRRK